MENYNSNKYNEIITNAVSDCTNEIMSLMKERGLRKIDFREHCEHITPIYGVVENGDNCEYSFEQVVSIHIDKNYCDILRVNFENGLSGYLDGTWGDYFDIADTVGRIYAGVIDIFKKVDDGEDCFRGHEYEEKYQNGVTKDVWDTIVAMIELSPEEIKSIKSMKITESDDKFDYIYVDFGDKFSLNAANYCAIRDKKNDDIYIPTNDNGAYPASLTEASMYGWVNQNHEKIMLNSNNEMETYDETTRKRLEYLNGEGNEKVGNVFDGIKFIWHKNHTICVKSQKDIREGRHDLSYIVVYNHRHDIIPKKFYREKLITEF